MRVWGFGIGMALALAGGTSSATAQGMEWLYTAWSPEGGAVPSISLDYGIAYTDAVQFSLECSVTATGASALVDFFSEIGVLDHGGPVDVSVMSPGRAPLQFPAQVFSWETGHTGARTELPMSHPFFAALREWPGVTFQLAGQQAIALPAEQGRRDITRFVTDCSALSPVAQPAPSAAASSCASFGTARSMSGDVPQQVTFSNDTDAARVLFWIDYEGQPEQIAIVEPGLWVTIDSYLTHPWMITDMNGACREMMQPQPGQDRHAIID